MFGASAMNLIIVDLSITRPTILDCGKREDNDEKLRTRLCFPAMKKLYLANNCEDRKTKAYELEWDRTVAGMAGFAEYNKR